ncbi:hypothetical protein [Dyadobacter endophyticus]|uniref:hypothetical protein n=1 Tax=Dyadobacter endophyticus TaxID=1749036 RepID=UPI001E5DB198|nr:hypothetical protein [Dyadobacter endophyticus]
MPNLLVAQNLYDKSFVNQLAINPAYASVANRDVNDWTANIVSFQTDIGSNTGAMSFWDLARLNGPYIRDRILTTSRISTGQGNVTLFGPGISARVSPRFSVSATTAIRLFSNYRGLDGRLISEIGEYVKVQQEYPYNMANREMRMDLAAFSEFAPGLSYDLIQQQDYTVSLGGALKLLMSNSHTSIALSGFNGTVNRYNSYLTALNDATGAVTTQTSGRLFDDFGAGALLSAQKLSLGGNLGFVFKHLGKDIESHDFIFAVSLIDIGSVRYKSDSAYTKSYDINIGEGEGLFFNNNFKNSNFSKTTLVFDKYPGLFQKTSSGKQTYKVKLPTSLVVQLYARYNKQLGVRLNGRIGLSKQNQDDLYSPSGLMLEPVYDRKKIQISLPISYYRYMGFGMGVAFKTGNLTFGSQTLLSSMITKSGHLDLSLAIELKKR